MGNARRCGAMLTRSWEARNPDFAGRMRANNKSTSGLTNSASTHSLAALRMLARGECYTRKLPARLKVNAQQPARVHGGRARGAVRRVRLPHSRDREITDLHRIAELGAPAMPPRCWDAKNSASGPCGD
jgi:hypothetical protein